MNESDNLDRRRDAERVEYDPGSDRQLSVAILQAIEAYRGEELDGAEFTLYDDVNPDAIDALFREESTANTSVRFETDGVTVNLFGDGTVDILVSDRDG